MEAHRKREYGNTPRKLLRTGRVLFSRRGYHGVSVRALARVAHVNLGAVRYHFGSKEGLYQEVLRSSLDPLRERLEDLLRASLSTPVQLRSGLGEVVKFLHADPHAALLVQRCFLEVQAWPAVQAGALVTLPPLARMIERGQEAGVARPGEPHTLVLRFLLMASQMALVCRAAGSCPTATGRSMEGRWDCCGTSVATFLVLQDEHWHPGPRNDIRGLSGKRRTP
jgi:AcrR family transcriptional regulator